MLHEVGEDLGQTQGIEVSNKALAGRSIDLVDGKADALAFVAQHGKKVAIGGGDFGAAVDYVNDLCGLVEGDAGLPVDLRGDEILVIYYDAAGVGDAEGASQVGAQPVDAVAGDPGFVADDGSTRARDGIE